MTRDERRETTELKEEDLERASNGSLPEILEVFGAAPLVPDEDQAQAPTSRDDRRGRPNPQRRASDPGNIVAQVNGTLEESFSHIHELLARTEEQISSFTDSERQRDERMTFVTETLDRLAASMEGLNETVGALARQTNEIATRTDALGKRTEDLGSQAVELGQRSGDRGEALDGRMGKLEEAMEAIGKQSSFIPPKLRGLGQKVAELSTSLADNRCRELLGDIVAVSDLVTTALDNLPEQDAGNRRVFQAVQTRIDQVLDQNDIVQVPTDIAFDPNMHNAIESVPVSHQDQDGQVLEVFRPGYRNEHSVLRYAEVAVGRFDPEGAAQRALEQEQEQAAATQPAPEAEAPVDAAPGTAADQDTDVVAEALEDEGAPRVVEPEAGDAETDTPSVRPVSAHDALSGRRRTAAAKAAADDADDTTDHPEDA